MLKIRPLLFAFPSLISLHLGAQDRFPKPDFESGHQLPEPYLPFSEPNSWFWDITILICLLILAAYFALRYRSRLGILITSLVALIYLGFWKHGCICSIGALQNIALGLTDAQYLVPLSTVIVFVAPLLASLLFGRIFCAAVCPMGSLQDFVIIRPWRLPAWFAEILGMIRYFYLGIAVVAASTGSAFLICRYDPFVVFFRWSGTWYILLFGFCLLLLGTVIARPYCRFICPYGVLLGWFARFSWYHLKITTDQCVACHLCKDACPIDAIQGLNPNEPVESGLLWGRRLGIILTLAIPVIACCAWLTSFAAIPLSQLHPTVALAEHFQRLEQGVFLQETQETKAFRAHGQPLQQLYEDAAQIQRRVKQSTWYLGIFLGLVFMAKLIQFSIYRQRGTAEPDPAKCVSCGRCFAYCPKESASFRIHF